MWDLTCCSPWWGISGFGWGRADYHGAESLEWATTGGWEPTHYGEESNNRVVGWLDTDLEFEFCSVTRNRVRVTGESRRRQQGSPSSGAERLLPHSEPPSSRRCVPAEHNINYKNDRPKRHVNFQNERVEEGRAKSYPTRPSTTLKRRWGRSRGLSLTDPCSWGRTFPPFVLSRL